MERKVERCFRGMVGTPRASTFFSKNPEHLSPFSYVNLTQKRPKLQFFLDQVGSSQAWSYFTREYL